MTIVLPLKHYKILLSTARIAYENTYDMREALRRLGSTLAETYYLVDMDRSKE